MHLARTVLEDGVPVQTTAAHLQMSGRSATWFRSYFQEKGGVMHNKPATWNRYEDNLQDDEAVKQADLDAVTEPPELFLDEIAVTVAHVEHVVGLGLEVSASSVSRVISHNGLTCKVLEKAFFSRNEAEHVAWVEAQWDIPLRCRVYVDEVHRTARAAERRWAWSQRGDRAECYVSFSGGVRTSFLVAMSHTCMLGWMITCPPPGQTSANF